LLLDNNNSFITARSYILLTLVPDRCRLMRMGPDTTLQRPGNYVSKAMDSISGSAILQQKRLIRFLTLARGRTLPPAARLFQLPVDARQFQRTPQDRVWTGSPGELIWRWAAWATPPLVVPARQ